MSITNPFTLPSMQVFNSQVNIGTYDDLLRMVEIASKGDRVYAIDTSNTMVLGLAARNETFHRALQSFDIILPDAMPLVWYMRLVGARIKDTCYGPETTQRILDKFAISKRIMIIGADETTKSMFEERFFIPAAWITRLIDTNSPDHIKLIITDIQKCDPDIIFLGLGCPKSYYLLDKIKHHISRGIIIHVGGSFDIISGTAKVIPASIRKLGLGWLYRLIQEPRRMWKRYLKYNSMFLIYSLLYYARNKQDFERHIK